MFENQEEFVQAVTDMMEKTDQDVAKLHKKMEAIDPALDMECAIAEAINLYQAVGQPPAPAVPVPAPAPVVPVQAPVAPMSSRASSASSSTGSAAASVEFTQRSVQEWVNGLDAADQIVEDKYDD